MKCLRHLAARPVSPLEVSSHPKGLEHAHHASRRLLRRRLLTQGAKAALIGPQPPVPYVTSFTPATPSPAATPVHTLLIGHVEQKKRYRRLLRKRNVPQTNSDVSPAPSAPDATLLCSSSQANFCSGISSYKVQWKFKPDWRIGGVCRLASTHEATLTQGGEPGKQGSASAPERREGKAPRAGDLGPRLSASLVPGRVDLVVLGRGLALVAAHPNGLGGGRRHPWTWRCARPAARSSCRCTTRARRFRRK